LFGKRFSVLSVVDPALKKALKRRKGETEKGRKEESLTEFIAALRLPDGKEFRWDGHEDLKAIAEDNAQVVIVEKAAQKGVTELMLRLQFWLCKQGYSSAYFLSSLRFLRMQVQRRVEPLIRANPILQKALVEGAEKELLGEEEEVEGLPRKYRLRDNLYLKRLWEGWLLYMPVQSEADVRMFPLDAIFVDEVETLNPSLTDALQERLYHSPLKWERWFSQPTVAGYGIDERFAMTDQRYWHLKCPKCKQWFAMEEHFPKVLTATVEDKPALWGGDWDATTWDGRWKFSYCCPFCQSLIVNPQSLEKEWVAKYPERDAHGYHLTQLYSATMTATDVARLWHQAQFSLRRKERFFNSILGLPYSGGERQPITAEKCVYGTHDLGILAEFNRRFAGLDVGDRLHLVILEQLPDGVLALIWAEEISGMDKWERVAQKVRSLKVSAIAVNAMPYKDSAKKLLRQLAPEIKGVLVYDTGGQRMSIGEEDKETGQPIKTISIPRVELMDGTVDAVLSGRIIFPRKNLPITEQVVKHLQNYIIEIDETGKRDYAKGREDHFGRAIDYARIVVDTARALKAMPAEPIRTDWFAGTPLAPSLGGVSW
jgi:hypothetical protein